MRDVVAVCLALALATQPALVCAQQAPPHQATQLQPPASPPAGPPSVEALGVSFERIKRALGEKPATKNAFPLKLDYYVEVVGLAPPIQLFTPEELAAGPVPGGPPTHWEMVDLWTKPEFKAPAAPIGSLAIMGIAKLIQWQAQQARKRKAEEERQRIQDELRKKYPDLIVK